MTINALTLSAYEKPQLSTMYSPGQLKMGQFLKHLTIPDLLVVSFLFLNHGFSSEFLASVCSTQLFLRLIQCLATCHTRDNPAPIPAVQCNQQGQLQQQNSLWNNQRCKRFLNKRASEYFVVYLFFIFMYTEEFCTLVKKLYRGHQLLSWLFSITCS